MGFKKFSAQRLINQYKFTRNRTSASGFLPMPNLPYHPITREASAAHKEIIKLRLLERVDVRSQESISERCRIAFHAAEPSPARFAPLCLQQGKGISLVPRPLRTTPVVAVREVTGLPPCQRSGFGLDALLRNPSAPLFSGARRLAQWTEALSHNGGRPGAKLFKALLRNSFKPFFKGRSPAGMEAAG